jgi:hypothetical protein
MLALKESKDLKIEQELTLSTPRMPYGLLAKSLFLIMDLVYGKRRTLPKFKVLEVIARVPYQAWEHVAYIAMTHKYSEPHFARRIFDFVRESRQQQDNEQWHLLILEEILSNRRVPQNFILYRVFPQIMAFVYYHISWLLYVIQPRWSYELNAHFEDHAEHEYMLYVQENPGLENETFQSDFANDYGHFTNLADLFRNIALDERHHKLESVRRMNAPRFR